MYINMMCATMAIIYKYLYKNIQLQPNHIFTICKLHNQFKNTSHLK